MPRALWTGAVRFGMVNIPVQLHTAVREQPVRFHQLHGKDGGRIRYRRVCELDGEEVAHADIVKGYEVAKGRFVTLDKDELKAFEEQASRAIDIEDFIQLEEIDPIFFESTYHLVPEPSALPAYRLLSRAMREEGRVAVGRLVLRGRERPCAIRPKGDALVLNLLHVLDEVLPVVTPEAVGKVSEPGARELEMARQLVTTLSAPFSPGKYKDTFRERVMELVARKAEGLSLEVPTAEDAEGGGKVLDLMEALRKSLAARGGGAAEADAATEAAPEGTGKRPARKRAAAKASPAQKGEKRARTQAARRGREGA